MGHVDYGQEGHSVPISRRIIILQKTWTSWTNWTLPFKSVHYHRATVDRATDRLSCSEAAVELNENGRRSPIRERGQQRRQWPIDSAARRGQRRAHTPHKLREPSGAPRR